MVRQDLLREPRTRLQLCQRRKYLFELEEEEEPDQGRTIESGGWKGEKREKKKGNDFSETESMVNRSIFRKGEG